MVVGGGGGDEPCCGGGGWAGRWHPPGGSFFWQQRPPWQDGQVRRCMPEWRLWGWLPAGCATHMHASCTPVLPPLPPPLPVLQAAKVYVQDRLAASGPQVWRLLEAGAHFYVCGDAGSMAGAVERQLLHIIEEGQGQGPAAAQAYLARLAEEQRYQRDVWLS